MLLYFLQGNYSLCRCKSPYGEIILYLVLNMPTLHLMGDMVFLSMGNISTNFNFHIY